MEQIVFWNMTYTLGRRDYNIIPGALDDLTRLVRPQSPITLKTQCTVIPSPEDLPVPPPNSKSFEESTEKILIYVSTKTNRDPLS
jgi:hypothetical protein